MEGTTPDYIGTWDMQVPARGLFEVYLGDDGINGTIEDCLGTARFSGKISSDVAVFVKEYGDDKSSADAARDGVMYAGVSKGEIIAGEFRIYNEGGKFRMYKFDGNPYPVDS